MRRNASLASGEFILVRGVPDELTLSDGMPTSAGNWVLGLEQSRLVDILSPAGYKGRFRILVEVMGAQGRPLLRHSAQIELTTSEIIVILARPSSLPAEDKRTVPQQHAVHAPTGTRQAETTRRKLDSAWSTSVAADPGPGTAETPVIAEGGNGIRERQPNLLQPAYGLGAAR